MLPSRALRTLLLIALLIAASVGGTIGQATPAYAGDGVWTTHGGPYGGTVTAVAVDPVNSDILYLATDRGVYKSTDAGLTAERASKGLPDGQICLLVVDPGAPTTVYAGTQYKGLFKSTDGAATWVAVTSLSELARSLVVDPQNPSTLYAGTITSRYSGDTGVVFKSKDGGGSWGEVFIGISEGAVNWLAIDPLTPATVYAVFARHVYKTADGGATWRLIAGVSDTDAIGAFAVDPHAPSTLYLATWANGLYRSTDGGKTWWELGKGQIAGASLLVIDPQTPSTLYAADRDHLLKSTDGGATWRKVFSTGRPDIFVSALAVDPLKPARLYVGTPGLGLFLSLDGGENWMESKAALEPPAVWALAVDPRQPSTIYALWSLGMHKSTDGGANWSAPGAGLPAGGTDTLAVDPKTPATLYSTGPAGVYKSTDGGAQWRPSPAPSCYYYVLTIDPQTPATVYIAGISGGMPSEWPCLDKSTDGGATWRFIWDPMGEYVEAIALAPAAIYVGTTAMRTGTGGGVYKSTNGGASWVAASDGLPREQPGGRHYVDIRLLAVDPATPETVYAGAEGFGVYKSTDGGGHWGAANTGLPDTVVTSLVIDPRRTATLYAGTSTGGVFCSWDGGASWHPMNAGLTNLTVTELAPAAAPAPDTATILYAGTDGGVFVVRVLPPRSLYLPLIHRTE